MPMMEIAGRGGVRGAGEAGADLAPWQAGLAGRLLLGQSCRLCPSVPDRRRGDRAGPRSSELAPECSQQAHFTLDVETNSRAAFLRKRKRGSKRT